MIEFLRALAKGNCPCRSELEALNAKMDRAINLLTQLLERENTTMKTLQDLQTDVTTETNAVTGVTTLLSGLSAQIAQLKSEQTDPGTAAKIDDLATQVESNAAALAAAVAANTPAAQ